MHATTAPKAALRKEKDPDDETALTKSMVAPRPSRAFTFAAVPSVVISEI
jgi:hypothetical protein